MAALPIVSRVVVDKLLWLKKITYFALDRSPTEAFKWRIYIPSDDHNPQDARSAILSIHSAVVIDHVVILKTERTPAWLFEITFHFTENPSL